MKIATGTVAALVCTAVFAAGPRVDQNEVTMTQPRGSSRVTITYTLTGAPGIVTVDIQTNATGTAEGPWVSIGDENTRNMTGDVNKLVDTLDSVCTVHWAAGRSWPNHSVAAGNMRAVVTAWATNAPPDYMTVNLGSKSRRYYTSEAALPLGIDSDTYRKEEFLFRHIRAAGAEFRMGSPSYESGRDAGETPHKVSLTQDYWLGVFELTQWQASNAWHGATNIRVLNYFNGSPDADVRPAENLGWYGFVRGDSTNNSWWPDDDYETAHKVQSTSLIYWARTNLGFGCELDLPTEAQWEYACRAGSSGAFNDGSSPTLSAAACDELDRLARYRYNGGYVDGTTRPARDCDSTINGTARVGSYKPNAWGLYDMHGNVSEWCLDRGGSSSYVDGIVDPVGEATGNNRILRGGSYLSPPADCRSASRKTPYWAVYTNSEFNLDGRGVRLCILIPR